MNPSTRSLFEVLARTRLSAPFALAFTLGASRLAAAQSDPVAQTDPTPPPAMASPNHPGVPSRTGLPGGPPRNPGPLGPRFSMPKKNTPAFNAPPNANPNAVAPSPIANPGPMPRSGSFPANGKGKPGAGGKTVEPEPEIEKRAIDRRDLQAKGRFKLKFDKVDIEELVKQVADMTGKLFILPESIRGKISIIGPEHGEAEVTVDEVYQAFLSALDANGITVYPSGKFLRITEKNKAKQSNIPTFVDSDEPYALNEAMITKMFRVKYVEAEPIRAAIQPLASPGGDVSVFPPDLIIVNDQALNMHRLEKIIEQLDQPGGTDSIHIVQVLYASSADLADKLTKIFEQKKNQPGQRPGQVTLNVKPGAPPGAPGEHPAGPAGGPTTGSSDTEGSTVLRLVIADERTNKLVVICNEKTFERVLTVVKDLDVPTPGSGGVHVYYVQNGVAEELSNTLSTLAQGSAAKTTASKGAPGSRSAAAELFSGEVKVTAEKSTNSLVIIGGDSDYQTLLRVLERLDVPRREVFVEAVIMEVNLDHENTFGGRLHSGLPPIQTNLFGGNGAAVSLLGDKFGNESLPPSFSIASLASYGGFLAGIQGPVIPELAKLGLSVPSFGVLIHALETNSDVNVLSTPHILTTDNEEAEITVGQNVPFQAGFSPSSLTSSLGALGGAASTATAGIGGVLGGGLASAFAPIQRQNVELKLKIKPQINEGEGMIRMVIDEQTEEIASTDPVLGPTTDKRTAKTTIVVRDQQTVVIGGMIQDRVLKSVNKVPILGDIPILGHLFREEQKKKLRTNLLLFLTPYIIRDQSDFQRIFQRKLKERQEFVEQFYGHEKEYEAYIDYHRKAGPISKMREQLRLEANRVENGGSGIGTGERGIYPHKRNPFVDEPGAIHKPSRWANPDSNSNSNSAPAMVPEGPAPADAPPPGPAPDVHPEPHPDR